MVDLLRAQRQPVNLLAAIQPTQEPTAAPSRFAPSVEALRQQLIADQPQTVFEQEAAALGTGAPSRPELVGSEELQLAQLRATAPESSFFARDIKEISEAPELQNLDLSALKPALASFLITNEVELAEAFKRLVPGTEVQVDPEGNPLVKFPSQDEPFAINSPGPSRQDFDQFIARLVAFTPAARFAGAGIKQLAKVGLASGGTEAGLQTAEAGLGGEFSPVDVAFAGVAAPAVQAAPAIKGFFTKQSPAKQQITKLIEQNSDDIQRAGFVLKDGVPVTEAAAKEAKRQGVDAGTVSLMQSASKSDKASMRKALDILKKAKRSKTFAISNRPGDAAGAVVKSRYDAVKKINRQAGKEVNEAAKALKGNANVSGAYNSFLNELQELGVTITRAKSGRLKGVYDESEFAESPSSQRILNNFIARSEKGEVAAISAHRLKRVISGAVESGKKNVNPILAKGEGALKTLRNGINETLREMSPAYKAANSKFSNTRGALDDFEEVAGPNFDPNSENASKQLVNITRSLMSNNQKRIPAMDSINALQESAKKFGVKFDDDILKQAAFMDELETLFGSSAKTSFGGQIEKATSRAIRGDKAGIAADIAEAGIQKVRGINEEKLIKSLEELLR